MATLREFSMAMLVCLVWAVHITFYVKSGTRITKQASICVFIKQIHLFNFFKRTIVSLDKTLIHRLVSFIALWSCTETDILTFNLLESIEVHYMDLIRGMFSSKTFISFRLKKEKHKHLGWHGGEYILIWKLTNPLRLVLWSRVTFVLVNCGL